MKALEPDLTELDGVIVQVEQVIHLSRECGAEDLVGMVKQGIAAGYYLASPRCFVLRTASSGPPSQRTISALQLY
jgi:hypothetical protein